MSGLPDETKKRPHKLGTSPLRWTPSLQMPRCEEFELACYSSDDLNNRSNLLLNLRKWRNWQTRQT